MKLSQATDYYSNTPLAGRNADGTWTERVVFGSFQAFDRFITERSFGQKKRVFLSNSKGPIPAQYTIVKTPAPDSRAYLVTAQNADFDARSGEQYNTSYLLQEAPYSIEVIELVTVPKASGMGGTATPTPTATVLGDYERLSGASSREFDPITYTTCIFTLPRDVVLTTSHELRVDGSVMYDVLETWREMSTIKARANKRSASA